LESAYALSKGNGEGKMRTARPFSRFIDSAEKIISVVIPVVLVGLIFILVNAEVLTRLFFNYSFYGIVDIVEQNITLLTFLALAVVQNRRGHITMDLLPDKLKGTRAGFILDCINLVVSIVTTVGVSLVLIWYMVQAFTTNIVSMTLFLPASPVVLGAIIGCVFVIIRCSFQLAASCHAAIGACKKDVHSPPISTRTN
jgi:TRAP-type C4-dicarboxylate transport system permease small subunit